MNYTLTRLHGDVMARLGEPVAPQPQCGYLQPASESISLKISAALAAEGSRLISSAAASRLGDAVTYPAEAEWKTMPCGLKGARIRLPPDFLRLVAVRAEGWTRAATRLVEPDNPEWERLWSAEPGIAGCAERPMAYLMADGGSPSLIAMGCSEEEGGGEVELRIGRVPAADADGTFEFPAALYADLVASLAETVTS